MTHAIVAKSNLGDVYAVFDCDMRAAASLKRLEKDGYCDWKIIPITPPAPKGKWIAGDGLLRYWECKSKKLLVFVNIQQEGYFTFGVECKRTDKSIGGGRYPTLIAAQLAAEEAMKKMDRTAAEKARRDEKAE